MKKKKKNILNSIYIIIFWIVIALLFGGQSYLSYSYKGYECGFWGTLFEHVPTFLIWALYAPLVQIFLNRFPIINSKRFFKDLTVHIGVATFLGIISLLIIGTGHWLYYGLGKYSFAKYLKDFSFVWFFYQYFMYTAMILFLSTINYYKKYRDQEAHSLELQKLLIESQLRTLKMQLYPHFLFNTLNTISMLIRMNRKVNANKVIGTLGDML